MIEESGNGVVLINRTERMMQNTESDIHQIQTISTALLAAAARGEIDLNQLAKQELANRGQDANGKWVGFNEAARIHKVTF